MEQAMIFNKIALFVIAFLIFCNLYLWQSNNLLSSKNSDLSKHKQQQMQTIITQKKILNVIKNTKPGSLATNIKRMQDGEL